MGRDNIRGTIAQYPPPSTYVQANIGRNVGDVPMSDVRWHSFIRDVSDVLTSLGSGTPEVHRGLGEWAGVVEESAHMSTFVRLTPVEASRVLDGRLGTLAREYAQDSIGLIVGARLVTPRRA